jgi:sugar lactone lactonase YvrE
VVADDDDGGFDGIRCDTRNTLWAAATDGVRNYATDGTLLGKIHLPEPASNLTFRGTQAESALRHRHPFALLDPPRRQRRGVTR